MKMLRMIVTVHAPGEVTTRCTDSERSSQSSSTGDTHSNRRALVNVLNELGERIQATTLETFPMLRRETTEVELLVPHTARVTERLGFYKVGEVSQS